MHLHRRIFVAALVFCVTVAAASTPLSVAGTPNPELHSVGQVQNGEVFGRVTDAADSGLSGVAVTISGTALLVPRAVTTSRAGTYWFAEIPSGTYTVVFDLAGFARLEQREVRLDAGFHAQVDAQLHASATRETVVVSRAAPVVDPRSTSLATNVTRERLEGIPSGRDPWAILSWDPASAGFPGRASWDPASAEFARNANHPILPSVVRPFGEAWSVDGGTITDRAGGGPPHVYDFGSFEEIRVQRASADSSVQGGGVSVNLITRSGSNRVAGSARYHITDRRLQSDNMTPELKAQGAGFGSPVHRVTEAGAEAGGPIARDKAWLWGSASRTRQDVGIIGFYTADCLDADGSPIADARYRAECMNADVTTIGTVNAKVQYQWSRTHRSTLLWGRSSRFKPNRGASARNRPEYTTRQSGLGFARPLQFQHQALPSDRLVIDAKYTFSDGSYILDFHEPGLASVQGAYDRYTRINSRSGTQSRYLRHTTGVLLVGNYFLSGFLGGDHFTKVGLELLDTPSGRFDRTGGGAVSVFDSRSGPPLSYQARIFRDGQSSHAARQWSAFFQDSFRRGRLTIDAGLRFDRQDDRALKTTIAANAIVPDQLPAVFFPGADSGVVYHDLSPRFGVIWDVTARGKTVAKASLARFRAIGNNTSTRLQPTGQTRLVYWWNDADGDSFVQRGELAFGRGLAAKPTSNYDAAYPGRVTTAATVDPNLTNIATDEFTLGLEHQVGRRLSVRTTYVVRKVDRLQSTYAIDADGSPVSSATFSPVEWTPSTCPAGAHCPTVTYYQRGMPLPAGTVLRNDGQYAWHHVLEVVLHKRLSAGWMLETSLAWNRAAQFFPRATRDYTDPTNIAMWNGTEHSMPQARWVVKASGMARLPWGFSTAAFFSAREGFPYDRAVKSPRRGALSPTNVSIARYGSERYPDVCQLDWRLDRSVTLGHLEVVPTLNVFNAFNSNTVLARNRIQNSRTANDVTDIAAPRSVRLDLALSW